MMILFINFLNIAFDQYIYLLQIQEYTQHISIMLYTCNIEHAERSLCNLSR